ncbi:MAG TPA: hypothetical protein VL981_04470 [Candidatus Methylacidiphilales bacterium]|nr:hypothetical protein [Candidatus Methylacidiphilales bacterium]
MTYNANRLSFQRPPGLAHYLWIPIFALLLLLAIDSILIPEAFTLPLLLLLILGYLAVRLPSWAVFAWGIAYGGIIVIILLFSFPEDSHTDPALQPYLALFTFIAVGGTLALLAGYRIKLEKSYNALLGIVTTLPVPVVVSDISGNILLLNHEAENLLYGQVNDLAGLSYFSTFTSPGEQGRAIAKYISYFDPSNSGPFSATLQTRGDSPKLLKASISIFGSFRHLYAVTVIEKTSEPEASSKAPVAPGKIKGSASRNLIQPRDLLS